MTGAGAPYRVPRDSTEAELDALMRVGERLGGFDPAVSAEWVDGALTALMAGPIVPPGPAAVVEALFGDAWTRTFADPDDVAQALAVLEARWHVLRSQLDPDALWEAPDALRLSPLLLAVGTPDASDRPDAPDAPDAAPAGAGQAPSATAGHAPSPTAGPGEAADAAANRDAAEAPAAPDGPDAPIGDDGPRLGEDWAAGFLAVAESPDWGWQAGDVESVHDLLTPVRALVMAPEDLAAHVAEGYGGEAPTPEQLVDDACYAVQDLRLWWVEHAPRTAPRRAEATPGRNDPCPCGSGKKYKKCHGAAA